MTAVRAALWDGRAFRHIDDLEVRAPQRGEVAVDIDTAGLCHSDLNPVDGVIEQPLPVVLGHEAVGVVSAVGPGASLPLGARVVLSVLRSCGVCRACRAGRPTVCRVSGTPTAAPFTWRGRPVHQFVRTGAFAARTVVAERQAVPITAPIDAPIAAMLGCASVTGFGAVEERARVAPGDRVLVTGAGGIGLNAVVAARAAGAERILVVDRNPAKEAVARRCGATDFAVTGDAAEIRDAAAAVAADGFEAAIECVGRPEILAAAVESLGWGGRCVIVGLPDAAAVAGIRPRALFHDKALLGCRMGSVDPATALPRLARRVHEGEIDLSPLVSKILPLRDLGELVDDLRAGGLDRGFVEMEVRNGDE